MTTTEFVAFTLGFAVLATCAFTAWCSRQKRRDEARDNEALDIVAAKVTEEARPRFTPDEARTLEDLTVRRRFANPQDTGNAHLLADEWRQIAPDGVDDATLGRLALAAYCTATAAWIGSPSGTWAMARVTKALGYAAVELTELERSELPK